MNVTEDTQQHIDLVCHLIHVVIGQLRKRARGHDASKFVSPEKEMYEIYRPKLDTLDIQSEEYKATLQAMGAGLQHHYHENRHHPEHFPEGISSMNLIDIVEMVCDWKAAAARKGEHVNMDWASKRFAIPKGSQLYRVIENTLAEL